MKKSYNFWIGFKKSVKNFLKVGVLPAVIYLISNYTEWLEPELAIKLAPVFGIIGYFITNYYKHK